MALPPPILLFFSGLLSKDNSGASMPGNEVVSLLALSCGSAEAGARVAASLRDSGVLRVIGVTESPIGGPFDPVAVYDVVEPESSSSPSPSLLAQTPPRPGTEGSSSALGRSSLSLSVTRSASRDADGGTTSAGVVRLLASSATVAGSAHAHSPEDGGPPSASLVAALVQAPLCVSVSVPSASRVLREDADSDSKGKASYTAYAVRVQLLRSHTGADSAAAPSVAPALENFSGSDDDRRREEGGAGSSSTALSRRAAAGSDGPTTVWTVHRRFHEFRDLHAALVAHQAALASRSKDGGSGGAAIDALPPFPSSSVLGSSGAGSEPAAKDGAATAGGGGLGVSSTLATLSGMVFGRGGGDPSVIEMRRSRLAAYMTALLSPARAPAWLWQVAELVAFLDSPLGTLTAQANYVRLAAAQNVLAIVSLTNARRTRRLEAEVASTRSEVAAVAATVEALESRLLARMERKLASAPPASQGTVDVNTPLPLSSPLPLPETPVTPPLACTRTEELASDLPPLSSSVPSASDLKSLVAWAFGGGESAASSFSKSLGGGGAPDMPRPPASATGWLPDSQAAAPITLPDVVTWLRISEAAAAASVAVSLGMLARGAPVAGAPAGGGFPPLRELLLQATRSKQIGEKPPAGIAASVALLLSASVAAEIVPQKEGGSSLHPLILEGAPLPAAPPARASLAGIEAACNALVAAVCPTAAAISTRREVLKTISRLLEKCGPVGTHAFVVGSTATCSFLPDGDVDIVGIAATLAAPPVPRPKGSKAAAPAADSSGKGKRAGAGQALRTDAADWGAAGDTALCQPSTDSSDTAAADEEAESSWLNQVYEALCLAAIQRMPGSTGGEGVWGAASPLPRIESIELVNAGKRVIRCRVAGIPVDISHNSPSALTFAAFMECADGWVDAALGTSSTPHKHLLKRSILLIKAWLEAEGSGADLFPEGHEGWGMLPRHALDSGAGGLSTAALNVLVLALLNTSPVLLSTPAAILIAFLERYAHFPWGSTVVTAFGEQPLYADPAAGTRGETDVPRPPLSALRVVTPTMVRPFRLLLGACQLRNLSSSASYSGRSGSGGCVHIGDPTAPHAACDGAWLGRSVSRAGLELLTRVLQRGHLRVQDSLAAAAMWETTRKPASAEAVTEGFRFLLGRATERFVAHKRASEPVSEVSVSTLLSGDSCGMNTALSHCACVLSPLITPEALTARMVMCITYRGVKPVGELSKQLLLITPRLPPAAMDATGNSAAATDALTPAMRHQYNGGIKRFLEAQPHIFSLIGGHPYNPPVGLMWDTDAVSQPATTAASAAATGPDASHKEQQRQPQPQRPAYTQLQSGAAPPSASRGHGDVPMGWHGPVVSVDFALSGAPSGPPGQSAWAPGPAPPSSNPPRRAARGEMPYADPQHTGAVAWPHHGGSAAARGLTSAAPPPLGGMGPSSWALTAPPPGFSYVTLPPDAGLPASTAYPLAHASAGGASVGSSYHPVSDASGYDPEPSMAGGRGSGGGEPPWQQAAGHHGSSWSAAPPFQHQAFQQQQPGHSSWGAGALRDPTAEEYWLRQDQGVSSAGPQLLPGDLWPRDSPLANSAGPHQAIGSSRGGRTGRA